MDREERAKREMHEMTIERQTTSPYEFQVWNKKGNKLYMVNLQKKECTCPDCWKHRNKCKHIFAVELQGHVSTVSAEEYMKGYIEDWKPCEKFTWF